MNVLLAMELGLQASTQIRYHQNMHSTTPCAPSCSIVVVANVYLSTQLESQISS